MRIGVDAMGGDRAPDVNVRGAVLARELLQDGDRVVLIGHRDQIEPRLADCDGPTDHIEVHHAEQVIGMDDSPVEALRTKADSSIAVLAELAKSGGLNACISAGNTGACVAAAQMRLRRLRGVHRPGIAVITPTPRGPVAVCDVGANVQCRPQHLHQYGVMASVYVESVCGVNQPRVGLLSIGEEDAKGNPLVKEARDLLKADPNVRFVGNMEGRDLFRGVCDVMVCDGFVGNVALKLIEGMARSVSEAIMRELIKSMPQHAGAIQRAGLELLGKYDYNEYGGAPLLGVGGIWIICHGASDERGIMNAVRVARDFGQSHVNGRITALLSEAERNIHA